ncbi:zinc metalloprotease HtpX [Candidatus Woesebacteria bacterium RIFCSPHIGHO2_01_FULL_44_10]|uniref:Protease HtpX homolog n=1 Tax=Candidatus Woesebacteria bacterium RIFCSPLOWO2_01_FULL_44_14 TaxID=1802525 RepID=A0A1F8BX91_9BACT|nr:MAG: zinc metalloprotease HtpX [Candidatus Woesebacteria bacterium RIFCSPHIGHO2_01_FULL_44_10]OGM56277.1 MAG: zinc metalloprotease HtpX [Candidatus Woesebacteria bacterium RIFCSPHIGHO2_12_FULL_44_11]OGM68713.1 MAG: zinc metalloprotease HtpX [Candidatus Woesebacteria bacterium RIFCSPLOWO2_01_FULL_44_14]
MKNIYEAAASNRRKSAIVIVAFVLFVTLAVYFISRGFAAYYGYETGGLGMTGLALIISGLMSLGSYWFSDKIVLGISGAKPAKRREYFDFYTVAENLAIASGLPKPKLYVIDDTAPNAFATGRDPKHAVVVATTGLLDKLNRTELEGVVAHELSHVKNYDTRLMSIVAVLVGLVALLGDWLLRARWFGSRSRDSQDNKMGALFLVVGLVFAILSPIIAQLIQLAISRRREFLADASAIGITRQPNGLISALKKISSDREPLEVANKATAHLYFANPLKNRHDAIGWFASLFNTHPPVSQRIKALEAMA